LNNGSVTLPMGGGSFFAGIFERKLVDDSPIFVLCTTASKDAAMKGDPEGIECIARFYDEQVTAAKTGFKAAWIGFLRAYNIFQFLPHSFFVTSRGLEANAYAALTDAIPFKVRAYNRRLTTPNSSNSWI
jgi:hypothetical protein